MVANQTKENRGRLKIGWGVGREESQSRKEGKAEAIDAIETLTQFFISQLHQTEKLERDMGKGKDWCRGARVRGKNRSPKT